MKSHLISEPLLQNLLTKRGRYFYSCQRHLCSRSLKGAVMKLYMPDMIASFGFGPPPSPFRVSGRLSSVSLPLPLGFLLCGCLPRCAHSWMRNVLAGGQSAISFFFSFFFLFIYFSAHKQSGTNF